MKKIFLAISLLCIGTMLRAEVSPVTITVTSSTWGQMYAWVWNTTSEYNNRFIPMEKINDTTWSLTLNLDLNKHKNAGLLFVDNTSWENDHQKTLDLKLKSACYSIPEKYVDKNLVRTQKGSVVLITRYKCRVEDCK